MLYLAGGWQAAQYSGGLYLQGLNLPDLAQGYYSWQNLEKAVFAGCLGMYFWREEFNEISARKLTEILPVIGVDGYDYISVLLLKYQESLEKKLNTLCYI